MAKVYAKSGSGYQISNRAHGKLDVDKENKPVQEADVTIIRKEEDATVGKEKDATVGKEEDAIVDSEEDAMVVVKNMKKTLLNMSNRSMKSSCVAPTQS